MTVTYNRERDQLEIHWSDEPATEWRSARSHVALLVTEANESVAVCISAASWLCPELTNVDHDISQTLPLANWPAHRAAPTPMLRGLGPRNAQPQLDWDTRDIPPPEPSARAPRGICRHCSAIAPDRRKPSAAGWVTQTCCPECWERLDTRPDAAAAPTTPESGAPSMAVTAITAASAVAEASPALRHNAGVPATPQKGSNVASSDRGVLRLLPISSDWHHGPDVHPVPRPGPGPSPQAALRGPSAPEKQAAL